MKNAIGIDIGGTKISMVVGTAAGKFLARRIIPTQVGPNTKQGVQDLLLNLKQLIRESKVSKSSLIGAGIGIPGPVDTRRGIVPRSPHLGGWKGLKLAHLISRNLKLPVTMANDANAAGVGEKIFGQGKGLRDFIYITVSTGIGGGIIVDGKLLEGSSFVAGEVGHMTIAPGGDLCKCGKAGCLEAYASGTAIASYVQKWIKAGAKTSIVKYAGRGEKIAARHAGLAAQAGDKLALKAYQWAGSYLGIGIANLLNILNPQAVILGGGVFKSAPSEFWRAMQASCKENAWPQAYKAVKITRTKLGDRVGDLGALALAFDKFGTH